ncbi:hypothetical protein HYV87_04380 [Candidatus Woesearchaeota archaeon]|nr:hypothetical protein [Candidatus Woesearchaeota archaeon]MBI2582332.1 hypothetical protein [Candidatus Woesearchaeota archaeon]
MSITREAAYLYLCSKELTKLNKKLHRLGKEAHSHGQRHLQATDESSRNKYQKRHHKTGEEIKKIMKEHHTMLSRIKHHLVNYNHALRKELKQ